MNFGNKFFRFVAALYNQPRATLKINGVRAGNFPIRRGTWQGCPLSSLIFDLCMEPLANMIQAHEQICGMPYGNKEMRNSVFADNVVLYLTSPTKSVQHLNSVLATFSKFSGLILNGTKSELYPIYLSDNDKDTLKNYTSYRWITRSRRHLGVFIPLRWGDL